MYHRHLGLASNLLTSPFPNLYFFEFEGVVNVESFLTLPIDLYNTLESVSLIKHYP
jgi:hypothetical protein